MDTETGMYYLMSRYYDPVTHRFLNADGYFQTGLGILDANMNAYCGNNPINCVDPAGTCPIHLGWYQPTCDICNPTIIQARIDSNVRHEQIMSRKHGTPLGSAVYSTGTYETNYSYIGFEGSPISFYNGEGYSKSNNSSGIFTAYANCYNSSVEDSNVGVSFQNILAADFSLGFGETRLALGGKCPAIFSIY